MERSTRRLIIASFGSPSILSMICWISFGVISSFAFWIFTPWLWSNVRRLSTFSGSGLSWVLYTNGISSVQYSCATVSFAISMKSSMILVATFASYGLTSIAFPAALRIILLSGKSKSMEPLWWRLFRKIPDSSFIIKNIGISASYRFFASSSVSSRMFFTSV